MSAWLRARYTIYSTFYDFGPAYADYSSRVRRWL